MIDERPAILATNLPQQHICLINLAVEVGASFSSHDNFRHCYLDRRVAAADLICNVSYSLGDVLAAYRAFPDVVRADMYDDLVRVFERLWDHVVLLCGQPCNLEKLEY